MSIEDDIKVLVAKLGEASTSGAYDGDRCVMCGHEVSVGSLLANSLANGALPKLHEHLLRATRLYTDELGALRKRVAELEALNEAGARAVDALEGIQIETMLPESWRAITSEARLELMALCCRSCGDLDPRCQCGNDE